jgi:hypothetical protein
MRYTAKNFPGSNHLRDEIGPRQPPLGGPSRAEQTDPWHDLDGFEQAWIAAGSLVAVGLLALAALAVFGMWVSLSVLLLGTTLAVSVDPTVWMPEHRSNHR